MRVLRKAHRVANYISSRFRYCGFRTGLLPGLRLMLEIQKGSEVPRNREKKYTCRSPQNGHEPRSRKTACYTNAAKRRINRAHEYKKGKTLDHGLESIHRCVRAYLPPPGKVKSSLTTIGDVVNVQIVPATCAKRRTTTGVISGASAAVKPTQMSTWYLSNSPTRGRWRMYRDHKHRGSNTILFV